MADPEEPLSGGNTSTGVTRVGKTVRKPSGPHTPAVHALLRHLHTVGFDRVPRALGIDDDGREVLSFVSGVTVHPDHNDALDSPHALTEVGRMIRRFHDASAEFVPPNDARWQVWIPDVGADLVVHHDLAAWNLVADSQAGWGLIDWDTAAPGTRLWDLAYAAHSLVPLSASPEWSRSDAADRLRVLIDAYDLDESDRRSLVALLPERTRSTYRLLAEGAVTKTQPWASLWADGHGEVWGRNTAYIEARTAEWLAALIDS
ncbi:MAG: aminoglycoside phosphotransferase family protein [Pseudonocardia sp.]|nr:aminoglycoside phosphotransferase family protein [Pseudonocardia sp.]